ncbi:hypothetical protein H6G20_17155 [Desertifilum sp. FACHB-1129]|uniref:Uncharacterized protein n=3 Tax=Cyanophyceae TaxID=3028117 RepID=A0A1E5QMU4_9CYAN|nr:MULTISPECIES: hypothetical protein [Cyanophyceae]MDA0212789.1 hypothetical protein [Cyanobacteria bacterium FC1]MDI9640739.1 hypothetical protein [Geitlerinema splendidum]MDK3156527.1 hypothetical protein [Kamptonema cortianum]MBD2313399.1 hypothetical protein [Desertifilum sp. FACHB-1129]MBD2324470.1 hypothetical protein [Desertifilum sp. FACHB-866]
MKRFLLAGFSVFFFSSIPHLPVRAESTKAISTPPTTVTSIRPFNLVYLAYQGYFSEAGIPGYGGLIAAYNAKRIDATDLVEQAIEQNRLPASMRNDSAYLRDVETQLAGLRNRSN